MLGELVPKRLAMAHADRWAMLIALPMQYFARVGAPLVWLLQRSTETLLKLLPVEKASQAAITCSGRPSTPFDWPGRWVCPNFDASTTLSRRPLIARPITSSLWPHPYMSEESR